MPPSISVNAARLQDAADAIRARGPLTIHLYTSPTGEVSSTLFDSGIVEPTFPGYAPVTLVEDAPPSWDGPSNAVLWTFNLVEFINTGTGVADTIQGYIVRDSGGVWVWAQALPTPVLITDPDQGVIIAPRFLVFNLHP